MLSKGEGGDIGFQEGVTNGVTNVLWNKIIRKIKTKKVQRTALHTST